MPLNSFVFGVLLLFDQYSHNLKKDLKLVSLENTKSFLSPVSSECLRLCKMGYMDIVSTLGGNCLHISLSFIMLL